MDNISNNQDGESQWLPISDLMSVLMMVFLLIAVSYMLKVYQEKEKITEIARTYNELQDDLYKDLKSEFKEDLVKWNAEIDKVSLSVRFKSPEILFETGESILKPKFKKILNNFFPRFIDILHKKEYRNDIDEIRIEGHTSSEWNEEPDPGIAYIKNMILSQKRTTNVLEYVVYDKFKEKKLDAWIRSNVSANGLSSSKLILDESGEEDPELSKRVEFRVKTNAEKRLTEILSEQ